MTLGRQGLLALLALVFLVGLALTISRLVAARRSGLSFRLQVFLPLAATTLTLSAAFAVIVIDRFTARASVFAQRGAQDEARVLAELASRELDAAGGELVHAAQQDNRSQHAPHQQQASDNRRALGSSHYFKSRCSKISTAPHSATAA